MIKFPANIILLLELVAFVASLIIIKRENNNTNAHLVIFLGVTFFYEIISAAITINYYKFDFFIFDFFNTVFENKYVKNNIWISNIFYVFWYSYILYYIFNFLEGKKIRIIGKLAVIAFLMFSLIDLYVNWNMVFSELLDGTTIVGAILFLVSALLYYYEFLKSDKILYFYKNLSFWVITSLLIFNLVTTPIFLFSSQLKFKGTTYNYILLFSNIILYGGITTGLIIKAIHAKTKQ